MRIIVFREGVSQGQRANVQKLEVSAMRKAIEEIKGSGKSQQISLVVVCVNKKTNVKLYFNTSQVSSDLTRVKSSPQGTFLGKNICNDDSEFYLISQQSIKGLASPTNYLILENDLSQNEGISLQDLKLMIANLTFKLCFLYYNTIGGIKTPAPIHYANKLSSFIKDNSNERTKLEPHQHLQEISSIYYI